MLAEQVTLSLSISSLISFTGHLRLAKEVISHLVNNATVAEHMTLSLSISSLLSSTGHLRLAKEVISHLVNNAS